MKKFLVALKDTRGASMVEYALLLVGVMIAAAGMYKALGPKVGAAATSAGDKL